MKTMNNFYFSIILSTIFLLNISCSTVESRPAPPIVFSPLQQDHDTQMALIGTANKWAFFMKIFTAGLYLDNKVKVDQVMNDVAKKIEVNYFYPIPGKKLSQYTKNQMKLNVTPQEYAGLADRLKILDHYFVDLKPGDRYALHYIPGTGTKFIYNGKEVGVIQGSDFAKGIFSVWLGDKPMDRHVKNEILGLTSAGYTNN